MSIQWRKCASQIKHVIQTISKHYQMANVSDSAVVLAYYTLLSLFPALLVIASLLPYLNIQTETVLESIEPMVPETKYSFILEYSKWRGTFNWGDCGLMVVVPSSSSFSANG